MVRGGAEPGLRGAPRLRLPPHALRALRARHAQDRRAQEPVARPRPPALVHARPARLVRPLRMAHTAQEHMARLRTRPRGANLKLIPGIRLPLGGRYLRGLLNH